jgi:hypothetical protein
MSGSKRTREKIEDGKMKDGKMENGVLLIPTKTLS